MPAQFESINSPVTPREESVGNGISRSVDNDDIVITGISGNNCRDMRLSRYNKTNRRRSVADQIAFFFFRSSARVIQYRRV